MQIAIALVVFVLLFVVLLVISAPLRAGPRAPRTGDDDGLELAELDAAREAKYREIRDAELDFRTGKLSEQDYAATDGALRAEAVEILDRLQAIEGTESITSDAEPTKANPEVEG